MKQEKLLKNVKNFKFFIIFYNSLVDRANNSTFNESIAP